MAKATGQAKGLAATPWWLWLIVLLVAVALWRWIFLVAAAGFLVLAAQKKTSRRLKLPLAAGGMVCLALLGWSLLPVGIPAGSSDAPSGQTPLVSPEQVTTPTNGSAVDQSPSSDTATAVAHPTEAERWADGRTIIQGNTTWKQYALMLPTEDVAPSKMSFTGFTGENRLWTTTFKDGSTMNAIFDKNMVLRNFDTDKP